MNASVSWLSSLCLLFVTLPSLACEGECIVGITNAFIGNYSKPVQHVFADLAINISKSILDSQPISISAKIVEPLMESFEAGAYNRTVFAIFPSYFHGKCQVNGTDPAGCPDPDCAVTCGTPGSLVHFYPILRGIVFNVTFSSLLSYLAPTSAAYAQLEKDVVAAAHARTGRDSIARSESNDLALKDELGQAVNFALAELPLVCGDDMVNCDWEDEMKQYILSFH